MNPEGASDERVSLGLLLLQGFIFSGGRGMWSMLLIVLADRVDAG
jgi:hypothetical protein